MTVTQKQCATCGRLYATEMDYLRGTSRWRKCTEGHLYFNCSCKSTIVIIKGKFDWYSPEKFMSEEAKGIFNRLAHVGSIPYLPTVAIELQEAIENDNSDAAKLAELARKDASLAAEILNIANASRAFSAQPVKTLEQAISLMGQSRLSVLCVVASVSKLDFRCRSYSKQTYFTESILTGMIAESLGKRFVPELSFDYLYIGGSFANIGKLLGALSFPKETDAIFERTERISTSSSWPEAEETLNQLNHCTLGEVACSLWGMEPEILDLTLKHHNPLTPGSLRETPVLSLVTFANQLCHLVSLNSHRVQQDVMRSCLEVFKVSDTDLAKLVNDLRPRGDHVQRQLIQIFRPAKAS